MAETPSTIKVVSDDPSHIPGETLFELTESEFQLFGLSDALLERESDDPEHPLNAPFIRLYDNLPGWALKLIVRFINNTVNDPYPMLHEDDEPNDYVIRTDEQTAWASEPLSRTWELLGWANKLEVDSILVPLGLYIQREMSKCETNEQVRTKAGWPPFTHKMQQGFSEFYTAFTKRMGDKMPDYVVDVPVEDSDDDVKFEDVGGGDDDDE